jgi:hypothetical protein
MGKFGDFDHGYPVDHTRRCIAKTARGRPCRKPAHLSQDQASRNRSARITEDRQPPRNDISERSSRKLRAPQELKWWTAIGTAARCASVLCCA